jgi:tetratricopeptide (TPR) repeat protein
MLDEASRLAAEGRIDRAIVQLSKTIRRNPRFWQAFQYRGELYLGLENSSLAIQDFTEAIRLAPNEAHLYVLRERACRLLDARSCP